MSSGQPPKNLMFNGDFEVQDKEKEVSKEMIGWDNEGCPKGWNSWARDAVKVHVVPEGRSGNAVKVSAKSLHLGADGLKVASDGLNQ